MSRVLTFGCLVSRVLTIWFLPSRLVLLIALHFSPSWLVWLHCTSPSFWFFWLIALLPLLNSLIALHFSLLWFFWLIALLPLLTLLIDCTALLPYSPIDSSDWLHCTSPLIDSSDWLHCTSLPFDFFDWLHFSPYGFFWMIALNFSLLVFLYGCFSLLVLLFRWFSIWLVGGSGSCYSLYEDNSLWLLLFIGSANTTNLVYFFGLICNKFKA